MDCTGANGDGVGGCGNQTTVVVRGEKRNELFNVNIVRVSKVASSAQGKLDLGMSL